MKGNVLISPFHLAKENESKTCWKVNKMKVASKYAQKIEEYLEKNPQGATFGEIGRELKIPDSTLDRALKLLLKEGKIVKNRAYYPAGANLAIPTFRMIMQGIEEETKFFSSGGKFRDGKKLGILFDELFGTPGHPAPYRYEALPDDGEILTLQNLLSTMIEKSPENGHITGLARFVASCFRYRANNNMTIRPILITELRKIEKSLFEHDKIIALMEEYDKDKILNSAWFSVYTVLYGENGLNDKGIADVLDSILNHVKGYDSQDKSVSSRNNAEDKEPPEKLHNTKMAIRNVLWCRQLKNALYNKQLVLFKDQLSSKKEQLMEFYGDLRRYAMEDSSTQEGQ